ncbi:hypothetical protein C8J57DRAFT_1231829 [Mycena rebaudengoi]|nr:hypothetical protein C8J57DRAFT_1231829 [Mycena rebaudengoi]
MLTLSCFKVDEEAVGLAWKGTRARESRVATRISKCVAGSRPKKQFLVDTAPHLPRPHQPSENRLTDTRQCTRTHTAPSAPRLSRALVQRLSRAVMRYLRPVYRAGVRVSVAVCVGAGVGVAVADGGLSGDPDAVDTDNGGDVHALSNNPADSALSMRATGVSGAVELELDAKAGETVADCRRPRALRPPRPTRFVVSSRLALPRSLHPGARGGWRSNHLAPQMGVRGQRWRRRHAAPAPAPPTAPPTLLLIRFRIRPRVIIAIVVRPHHLRAPPLFPARQPRAQIAQAEPDARGEHLVRLAAVAWDAVNADFWFGGNGKTHTFSECQDGGGEGDGGRVRKTEKETKGERACACDARRVGEQAKKGGCASRRGWGWKARAQARADVARQVAGIKIKARTGRITGGGEYGADGAWTRRVRAEGWKEDHGVKAKSGRCANRSNIRHNRNNGNDQSRADWDVSGPFWRSVFSPAISDLGT